MFNALYRTPAALLTLTALMWAMNTMFGQLAVGEISPMALVFLRWAMVVTFLWPIYGRQVRAHWPAIRAKILPVIFMAVVGFTGFNTLFYIASIHTSGINVGIIQGGMPALVMIGTFLVFGERVGLTRMSGVAITLAGVITIASKGDLDVLLGLAFNYGDMLMLIAAISYSAYTVAIRGRPDAPGVVLFTFFALIALISAFPLAVWEAMQPGYAWPTATGWGVTVLVAIFPSCLAQICFLRGVDLIGPGRAGVYINLVPIFASILAVFVLGEAFAAYHAAALGLVLLGLWISQRSA